ncbi:MAG: Tol-Pal system beta propeller repeat protein TolB [Gammaproteobacteria bacterium]|nr:Tol-Pal system beta propeller repeat protein TolB [Gammaproteobacteria bacterium]MDP6616493.1 Tol-Pal system beta propeller repeat protein TolB [Gammaproteobacteria bacterium]MDP6694258.1 Tol-Pal system beta propeller repeat protein TolB [Gammaproteobacteria bacterium]MDP7041504.1 Tol-Pal system beta propeller repeat protein TolB [Gammaproteobacteria bacterium]
MGRNGLRLICFILGLWLSQAALAELRIEITKGQGEAVPIAVVPFGYTGSGEEPFAIADVVAADLARTGRFAPIAESDMLQKPTTGAEIDFGDWRIIDTEVVIVGRVTESFTNDFLIEFRVFDVFRAEQLLGFRLKSNKANLRRTAHRISDMIYEELTGVKGIASTRIAYVNVTGTTKAQRFRLIVADADGENAKTMMESSQPIMSPAWSPDGRKLAYVSFENNQSQVWVQIIRTGARTRVSARKGVNSAPVWSPDGRLLALTLSKGDGNLDIYTLRVATKRVKQLTTWPSIETEPNWSADGKHIYFTSDRSGGPQIYRIPADGGRADRITFEGSYNARPRLSPDGKQIGVVHNDRGNYRIAVVDVERAYTRVLTDGSLDESPSFAPNGEVLIFASRSGGKGYLAMVSVDGRFEQRIAETEGDVREPAWSPFPLN